MVDKLRRARGVDVQSEIRAVWEDHEDEDYRRDQSHWRGVGRWNDEQWSNIGRATLTRVDDLHHSARRSFPPEPRPVMLEWGPGGGANLHALANVTSTMYGVDISASNLEECERVLAESGSATRFHPIHLTAEPAQVLSQIEQPVDLFVSTAVFQHFPSKEYGADVLEVIAQLLKPKALGYVQIRYDDNNPKYAPKPLSSYRSSHITATSYEISEFWALLAQSGLPPLKVGNLNTKNNYASFYFRREA